MLRCNMTNQIFVVRRRTEFLILPGKSAILASKSTELGRWYSAVRSFYVHTLKRWSGTSIKMLDYGTIMLEFSHLLRNGPLAPETKGPTARQQPEESAARPSLVKARDSWLLKCGFITTLIVAILVLFIQWTTGAWRDDFSATGDEPSHFTSSVAMTSYLTSGQILRPYAFVSRYYLHYPKVAYGKWPPFFYVISGVWFLMFSPSRLTAMLLIALETTLLGLVTFWVASRLLSPLLAIIAAITVVITPFFALHSTIFMLEPQTALLGLLSLVAFSAVLENPGWKTGVAFALVTSACILTKANGWALMISAGLGYLWLRTQNRARFLPIVALLVATTVMSAPFYVLFVHAMSDGNLAAKPSLWFTLGAVPAYLKGSAEAMGLAVCGLFLMRLFLCVRNAYRPKEHRPLIALLVTWTVGPFMFQAIVPASFEIRHLAIAFPCVVLLAFTVIDRLFDRFGQGLVHVAGITLLLVTVPWAMPQRYSPLFLIAAPQIASKLSSTTNQAILLSSNGSGEGRLVASMAALDPKGTKYFCVRATKLIVDSDWGAFDYHLLARTKEDVLKKLDSVPVGYVAIHDMGYRGRPHYALLRDAVLSAPEKWRPTGVIESVSVPDGKETLTIYENSENLAKPVTTLNLDLRRKLGRTIALQSPD